VDVYGTLDASINNISFEWDGNGEADDAFDESAWSVGEHGISSSKLGFKGSEDLGGGMKAIWQIESTINVEGTGSTIGTRNTFVGLSGGFGTVLIGNHDTPEKMSTGRLDFFADSVGDNNVSAAIIDTRENNVVAYVSPSFSGLTVAAAMVAGEFDAGTSENDGIADHYSVAAMYDNGPLYVSAAYTSLSKGYALGAIKVLGEDIGLGTAVLSQDDAQIYRVGAGFTMGDLKIGAVYQNVDLGDNADIWEQGYSVGASYGMGPMVLKAQYQAREEALEGFAVGVDYNMSKRTKAYVVYSMYSEEDKGTTGEVDLDVLSLGVRHNF